MDGIEMKPYEHCITWGISLTPIIAGAYYCGVGGQALAEYMNASKGLEYMLTGVGGTVGAIAGVYTGAIGSLFYLCFVGIRNQHRDHELWEANYESRQKRRYEMAGKVSTSADKVLEAYRKSRSL